MTKKIVKALLIVLTVSVFSFGIALFASWYSNGWESLSAIYVKYDGSAVKKSVTLAANMKAEIFVKSAGFLDRTNNYTVQILPNSKSEFVYTVNGTEKRFSEIEDLTAAFDLSLKDNSFVINLTDFKGEAASDMLSVLKRCHGESAEIEIKDELKNTERYFILKVYSEDGLYSTTTHFNVLNKKISVGGIEVDPGQVIL